MLATSSSSSCSLLTSNQTTKSSEAHLARVRDNQRRSRARRKQYLDELESKLRKCEATGAEASSEMQVAAREVLEENARLRQVLKKQGMSEQEINTLAASEDPSGLQVSGLFSPSQALFGHLNTRKSCSDCSDSTTATKQEQCTSQKTNRKPSTTNSIKSERTTDVLAGQSQARTSGDHLRTSEQHSSYHSPVDSPRMQQTTPFTLPLAISPSAPQSQYNQYQTADPDPLSHLPSSLSSLLQIWPESGDYQGLMMASAQDQSPHSRSDQSSNANQMWSGLDPLNDSLESLMTPEQRNTFAHYLSLQQQTHNQRNETLPKQDFDQQSSYSQVNSLSHPQPFSFNAREDTASAPNFPTSFHDSPHTHPMRSQYEGSETNITQPPLPASSQLDQPAMNLWQNTAWCHRTAEWKRFDDPCWQECSMLAHQAADTG